MYNGLVWLSSNNIYLLTLYPYFIIANAGCGEEITIPGATFSSTNYPNDYPSNEDCSIAIRFAAGVTIYMELLDFDVELDNTCR